MVDYSSPLAEKAETMIRQAFRRHEIIYPCASKTTLSECFTLDKERLVFWFNTPDNSTHVMMADV